MVHRPQDLDTASSLAFLQEEATQDLSNKSEMGHYSKKHSADSAKTSTSSLPSPPRTADEKKSLDPPKTRPNDDKLSALKSYIEDQGALFQVWRKMESTI